MQAACSGGAARTVLAPRPFRQVQIQKTRQSQHELARALGERQGEPGLRVQTHERSEQQVAALLYAQAPGMANAAPRMACPTLSSISASLQLTGEPSNCKIQYTSTVPTNQPIRLKPKLAATAALRR
jgi:hypothetical protein